MPRGPSETPVIQTEALSKSFGSLKALDSIDLQVLAGAAFGFIGPNGAGKTTTIRLLLDFLRPSSGRALIFGQDPRLEGAAMRRRIGYLPGELHLDERLTARQQLTYLARLRSEELGWFVDLAEMFQLPLDRKIKELSTGGRQKVGVVQAFSHWPDVVILDEPTSGLDPLLQKTFQELLRERMRLGLTAFISSHVLSELEEVATDVAFIRDGKILQQSPMNQIQKETLHRVTIHFASRIPAGFFDRVQGVSDCQYSERAVSLVVRGSMEEMMKRIGRRRVLSLSSAEPDLEEMFLAMYGEG